MKNYIFLDIDGVLCLDGISPPGQSCFNAECEKNLIRLIEEFSCDIVLASSWRTHEVESSKKHLLEYGANPLWVDRIVGVTIRAYQYLARGTGIHLGIPRGVEIKQWIDTHIQSENGKNWGDKEVGVDFNYVIIDDDTDMLLEHKDNFVNTDHLAGFTEGKYEQARLILNNCATQKH